jgi:hypothetical protein
VLLVALIAMAFAAARGIGTVHDGQGRLADEVGACLMVALLMLTSARCAADARSIIRLRPGGGRSLRSLARAATAAGRDAVTVWFLAIPALAVGWETGATPAHLIGLSFGVLAVAVCGSLLGLLLGVAGLPVPAAAVLASSSGAVILWPATLGWSGSTVHRFPLPEMAAVPLFTILLITTVLGAGSVALRTRRTP